MTAVEYFVEALKKGGVEWMATLCGHGLDPFFHAARRAGMRLIDTRNEQTAAYLADAYGRLTGKPGVCAVSSGIAHVNALTGVANAHFDRSPMLLISGAGALRTAGLGHFQDLNQAALAAPITKYSRVIDCADRVQQIFWEAMTAAMSPPPGPVHLAFPLDVQTAEVDRKSLFQPAPGVLTRPGSPGAITHLEPSLRAARRPLIVAGSGVFHARAGEEVMSFSERLAIPLVIPIWDRGIAERPGATFMGVIGAASGGPKLLPDADLVILAGAEPDYRLGFLQPPAVREDAPRLRLDDGFERLREISLAPFREWLAEACRRRDEFRNSVREAGERQAEKGTHAIHILAALSKVLTEKTVLLIDGGSIGQWAHQLLADRYPGRWLTCGRSAVVGWGIGGAMAARLAYPDSPVILLSGDGAFTFNVAELECAVRQGLHFVALVADDQGWGITRTGHLKQFGEAIASSLGPIAFDRLAEALGARGAAVIEPEQIAPELERALARPEVTVLHVPVVGGNPA